LLQAHANPKSRLVADGHVVDVSLNSVDAGGPGNYL